MKTYVVVRKPPQPKNGRHDLFAPTCMALEKFLKNGHKKVRRVIKVSAAQKGA